jgi:hypothetical protein
MAKLANSNPGPANKAEQLAQWVQRVLLLYGNTSAGQAKNDVKAEVKAAIDTKANVLRKSAQSAQVAGGHTHGIVDHPAADNHPARKATTTNDVMTLTTEAKTKPAADQPAYQQALRHLKQEIDAYDGYAAWFALQ